MARTDRSRCPRRILALRILAPTKVWSACYASVRAILRGIIVSGPRSFAPKPATLADLPAVAHRRESGLPSGDTDQLPGIVEQTVSINRREARAILRRHGGSAHRGGMIAITSVACEDRGRANASLRE